MDDDRDFLFVPVIVIYVIFNQIQQIQPLDIESVTVFNSLAFYDVPKQNLLEQVSHNIYTNIINYNLYKTILKNIIIHKTVYTLYINVYNIYNFSLS
jgi:hypothetical protein